MNILELIPEIKDWEFGQEFFTFPSNGCKIIHNVLPNLWLSLCVLYS